MQYPSGQPQQRTKGGAASKVGMTTATSSSTARPGWIGVQRQAYGGSSRSTVTIGTTDLNEEEEFYYAASRGIGPGSGANNGHGTGRIRGLTSGSNEPSESKTSLLSPDSPLIGQHWRDNLMPEPPILLAPLQTTIKAPSESEMILYTAHVELPKLTLYTVGQTCLNPYWGTNSGTRARYDAYMMWIVKGRYGYMPNAAGAGAGLLPSAQAQVQAQLSGRPFRKGSSHADQANGAEASGSGGSGGGSKDKQPPLLHQQQHQQSSDVVKGGKNKDQRDKKTGPGATF
ncbi:MAG: hypothetical protein JOS17DRAFT_12152 [Linnemannia elongata]|nr:MAG: hypothetical protein JOS17DRAFT_12152 [Linnemannia elongata]